jgi:succinylglutamic semialdehyde dehydrogenase
MNKTTHHYIDGQWISGLGESFTSINPANALIIWHGTHATEVEISAACDAAHRALPRWAQLNIETRAQHMRNFGQQIEAKRQELTLLIAQETGKPLWEAATEVGSVIGKIDLSIQSYQVRTAEQQTAGREATSHLRYKPHGVVAVLGPFNFPAHLSNGHIIPALLAGNTVVYKPSELTPAVAEFIIKCWHDSGLPAGVINCVQGSVASAKMLLNQDIQGVYFTGSYNTGRQINTLFSDRPEIILALEMGGNNPLIIDAVENIPAAVYHSLLSTFITAGQRCTCARRLLIADNEAGDQFLDQFLVASKRLRVGTYTDNPEPFMGPVISHEHALSHLKSQDSLQKAGGHVLLSMTLLAENTGLLSPGIIDMTDVATPTDEEIFAPFVQIHRYQHFDHALELANQTHYGLAAGLLSDSQERYQQFYQTIRAGLINWNRPTTGAVGSLPFGGIGRSGNHRPSAYFAADYCAYPIASLEQPTLAMPAQKLPGIAL